MKSKRTARTLAILAGVISTLGLAPATTFAQTTAFTYQGRLNDGANPANGSYDLRFTVFPTSGIGSSIAGPLTNTATLLSNGLFTVLLDFGAGPFTGQNLWLELAARTNGSGGFTTLSPRQRVTPAPYAIAATGLLGPLSGSLLQGTYPGVLTLNNAANQLTGSFTGNGAGVTNLNAAQLLSGTVPDARLSANVALRAGGNSFTGNQSISGGNLSLGDANSSVVFPAVAGASSPMITMFASGTGNANRMVLAHSLTYANWGLQYQDGSDQFDFLSGGSSVLTIALGTRNVGIGTNAPAAKLDVNGTIRAGGGILFPDGSIQTSAAAGATSPTTASGYPSGTTVSVTLNGSPCALDGPVAINGLVEVQGSYGIAFLSPTTASHAFARVKRARPVGPSNWASAFSALAIAHSSTPDNPTNWFTLVVTVTQPGGATQSITFSQLLFYDYQLTGVGSQLFEVADLIAYSITSPAVRSGSLGLTTPSADLPGLSVITNGAAFTGVVLSSLSLNIGEYTENGYGVTGIVLASPQFMILRANLSSGAGLLAWRQASFAPGWTTRSIAVQQGGVTVLAASNALGVNYRLRLAADGLPIEELEVAYVNMTAP